MAAKQQTLKAPISFSGTGLHTGVKVTMTVHPAPENSGIVFRRIDLEGKPEIPALCDYVTDTSRGTTIEKDGARVEIADYVARNFPGTFLVGIEHTCREWEVKLNNTIELTFDDKRFALKEYDD